MKVEVREAKKEDFKYILNLWKKNTDYHYKIDNKRYLSGREREEKLKKFLKEFFAKNRKNKKFLVAVKDGKPIGCFFGTIYKSPNYLREKRMGELHLAFVEEKFRRKGIGKMLFEKLMKWFEKRKIRLVEVLVDSRNEIAISAYKKYGFSEVAKRMSLNLSKQYLGEKSN
ncbi:MAG: GNAT family N-acetyltransferase [Candidatus Aenigmatarchaeota archaeon]